MPRPLRIQYEGACYHVMSRGDRREAIFADKRDRMDFLRTLGQACTKTGWQVHAYCLMTNHFHLVVETPQPNLSLGMKWLLGTYTQHFNQRHCQWGHLFGGRYKAQLIDERSGEYFRVACDYVHLNPVRAALVKKEQRLESFPWSSYPAYRQSTLRQSWLRTDRLMGEYGLDTENARSCREFERAMEAVRQVSNPSQEESMRCSWKIGANDFRDWLANKLARRGRKGERAQERRETDAALAERLVKEALRELCWREADLASRPKGDSAKIKIARRLRIETPMTRQWIADRLTMGSASYVSNLLSSVDSKL